MAITRIKLNKFTAFEDIAIDFSPGINVFIGANGTGKTHLMKLLYSACDITKKTDLRYSEKLIRVFLPSNNQLGRLVKRQQGKSNATINISRDDFNLRLKFSSHDHENSSFPDRTRKWKEQPIESVYIPVKEMLSNAPGFLPLYNEREIHFEEIYADIISRALKPALRGPANQTRRKLLEIIRKTISGNVQIKDQEFFLRNKSGNLEFTLLAEGMRKLGLLWQLINNETLRRGTVLFWDEPETNLNPKLFGSLIEVLYELQCIGVQIFIATHDYVILKEFDLKRNKSNKIAFHSLFHGARSGEIECHSTESYLDIHPNTIADAFSDLYDREVKRSLGGTHK